MAERLDLALDRMTNVFRRRLNEKFDQEQHSWSHSKVQMPISDELDELHIAADNLADAALVKNHHRPAPFYRRWARVFGWRS